MKAALRIAGFQPTDIQYINAHATSTPLGDVAESRAIETLFGAHARSGNLAVSSIKGAVGHLLGAAGAVEAIATVLAIHHGVIPPNANLDQVADGCNLDYVGAKSARTMPITAAISNSFGFGGTNTSLVFCKY
jgi:3-oxoacyl-[acyl-carrier-protein] synthase II